MSRRLGPLPWAHPLAALSGVLAAVVVGLAAACVPPPAPPPASTTSTAAPTTAASTTAAPTTPSPTTGPPTVPRATTTTMAPPPIPGAGVCPSWQLLANPKVAAPGVAETSGLAGGQLNPGVWWVHNDSGDSSRVFALEGDGRLLSTVTVNGATNSDWEDVDIGPGPGGQPYLWLADLGDNGKTRQGTIGYQLYRFPEPSLGLQVPSVLSVTAERIDIRYPDGPHNVEATLIDPVTGDYFIISKERVSSIFRIPAASLVPGTTVTATKVGQMMLVDPNTTHDRPVAADISADGAMIVVKTLELTFFWRRAPGQAVADAFSASPCPAARLGSGEAIAFNASGGQLATLAEGTAKPLFRYQRG